MTNATTTIAQEIAPLVEVITDNLYKSSRYAPLYIMLDEFQEAFMGSVDAASAHQSAEDFSKRFQSVADDSEVMPEERARAAFLAQQCDVITQLSKTSREG